MGTYVQLMPRMVQRRMEEMESKAAENAKAAEALASSSAQASPAPPLEEPPLLTASVTDDARGSLAKPAASEAENNSLVSPSATASAVKSSSAAAPLTPASEEGWLNNPGKGPSYAASFPQPPVANAQIALESSPPVVMATPKRSSSAEALAVSKSTENPLPSGRQ